MPTHKHTSIHQYTKTIIHNTLSYLETNRRLTIKSFRQSDSQRRGSHETAHYNETDVCLHLRLLLVCLLKIESMLFSASQNETDILIQKYVSIVTIVIVCSSCCCDLSITERVQITVRSELTTTTESEAREKGKQKQKEKEKENGKKKSKIKPNYDDTK